jgi:PBSX family phage terminase large subunit
VALFDYSDFSPKQLEVLDAELPRITILEGSVRSGKTIASIIRWICYVAYETDANAKLLMIGVTADTLYRNVISDLLDIVGPEDASYADGVLTLFGRTVYCVGARDVGAEKRIRGMTVSGCYIDEVTQIPEVVVKQAITRCSKGKGRLIWTTNPDSPYHWCFKDYVGNDKALASGRVVVYHFTLDDNFALSEEYKEDLKAGFTGVWYFRMVLGMWVIAEGVIYDHFSLDKHGFTDAEKPAHYRHRCVSIDYGTQNPFHALDILTEGDRSWVQDEWRYCGREAQAQMTDAQYSAALFEWLGDRTIPIIVDPSATSFIAQLQADGWTQIILANNDVKPGLLTTSNRLGLGKLRVHKTNCPFLVKELGTYAWDPKAALRGEDLPLKQHDHGPDALRYHEFTLYGPVDVEETVEYHDPVEISSI